jgi:hypothetical protein
VSKFPKPPGRYDQAPSSPTSATAGSSRPQPPARLPQASPSKPTLPPRLPPRESSSPSSSTTASGFTPPSPSTSGQLNQNALSRLTSAGISVPGFNIGQGATAPPVLPSRNGASSAQQPSKSAAGTTWAEKQSALRTASAFKKDPTSVSLSEVRGAAEITKNFHDRHGEQIASEVQSSSQAAQKYGLASGKKAPPPPPAKKRELQGGPPPPVPLGSKPKPV